MPVPPPVTSATRFASDAATRAYYGTVRPASSRRPSWYNAVDPMPVPKLRPLDLVATEWNGRQAVFARDYEGLLPSPVLLPLLVFLVALFLDGRREALEVQVEYARLTGGGVLPPLGPP